MNHRRSSARAAALSGALLASGCAGLPASAPGDGSVPPSRAALIAVAPQSADCAVELARADQLVADLVAGDREVFVFRVEGTAAGAALIDFGIDQATSAKNTAARDRDRRKVVAAIVARLGEVLCAPPLPVPGTGLDVVEFVRSSVRRGIGLANGRPGEVYALTSGLHRTATEDIRVSAPPTPDLSRLIPRDTALEIVIQGAGDFGGQVPNLDAHFVERTEKFARDLCDAIDRWSGTPIDRCSVVPTFEVRVEVS